MNRNIALYLVTLPEPKVCNDPWKLKKVNHYNYPLNSNITELYKLFRNFIKNCLREQYISYNFPSLLSYTVLATFCNFKSFFIVTIDIQRNHLWQIAICDIFSKFSIRCWYLSEKLALAATNFYQWSFYENILLFLF